MAEILPGKIRQTFTVLLGWLEQSCLGGVLVPHTGTGMWLTQTLPNFFFSGNAVAGAVSCSVGRPGWTR